MCWGKAKAEEPEESSDRDSIPTDAPIRSAKEDLLERGPMAKRIANILAAKNVGDGRVFALRGSWGDGKTSLKNVVIQNLKDRAPVLEFNPWRWGDSDAIAHALFNQIASALGGPYGSEEAKRAAAFRRYGRLLNDGANFLERLSGNTSLFANVVALVVALLAAAGLALPKLDTSAVSLVILLVLGVLWLVSAALRAFGKDHSQDALEDVRTNLVKQLKKIKQPIIVFVDDIDRLEPDQIRTLIRQIKANATLPNINFVLLFQPSIVEAALAPIAAGEGREYLEKIVQANFDLPPLNPDRVRHIFTTQLGAIVDAYATPENGFEERRWGNVLLGSILPFLRNLRDARRLLSSIAIHLEMHKGEHAFEVNLIDFIVLEALRVFEPSLHNRLAANRSLLLQRLRFSGDGMQDQDRQAITALVDTVSESRREMCRTLLRELFPQIDWAFGGSRYGADWIESWMTAKRVCTTHTFDTYFDLQAPSGSISESDFAGLIAASADDQAWPAYVQTVVDRDLRGALAMRLDQSVRQLPIDRPERWLALMLSNGEQLARDPFNDSHLASWRSAIWYLRRLPKSSDARAALLTALQQTQALSVAAYVISIDDEARKKPDPQHPPILDEDDFAAAKAAWVSIAESKSNDIARFLEEQDLVSLLYRWRDFASLDQPRAWVARAATDPHNVLSLLRAFVNVSSQQYLGEHVAMKVESFRKEYFDDFLPVSDVKEQLAKLDRTKLSNGQRKLVEMFENHAAKWAVGYSAVEDDD